MMRRIQNFLDVIGRRKSWNVRELHQTDLTRSLNILDLVGIGIGSCTGLGIYVTSSHVAKQEAGPAVVLSVMIAGIAALLSGLCHIELATRLPRSGTGYTFCYVTFGELLAFVIGWSLIMDNVINGALASKAVWHYTEYMFSYTAVADSNVTIVDDVTEGQIFATSPDIFPCCLAIGITFITLTTVKTYAVVNFVLTSFGGLFVVAFVCVGFFHVDSNNWNSPPGFFSQGLDGVISGAAILMSTFASVDNLASCVEESRTPSKSLPTAFAYVISIVFATIFLAAMALTLATPWQRLVDNAALARAYEIKGIFFANYVIGSGAILGLLPVLMGSFLHPVRILFSISTDNLLPNVFSKFAFHGVPVVAHFLTGVLISVCALVFEFSTLLEISSISTIIQFVASPIIVLYIRYQPNSVGINREYTDLDILTAYDEASISKNCSDFSEKGQKLVLLANGEHFIQRNGDSFISSNHVSRDNYKMGSYDPIAAQGARPKHIMYPSTEKTLFHQLLTLAPLSSTSKWRISKCESQTQASSEKHDATNSQACCEGTQKGYGLTGSSGIALSGYSEIRIINPEVVLIEKDGANQSKGRYGANTTSACDSNMHADDRTWKLMRYFLLLYIVTSTCLVIVCQAWLDNYAETWWAMTLACLCLIVMLLSTLFISRLPQNRAALYFKVPYLPYVPLVSVTVNMTLLASLPVISWIRFALWLLIGLLVYAFYRRRHKNHDDQESVLFDIAPTSSPNSN